MQLKPEHLQIVRFAFVGATASVTYFLVALFLSYISDIETVFASVIAYAIAAFLSFLGHRKITFKSEQAVFWESAKFVVANGVGLALALILPTIISGYYAMPSLLSFIVVMLVVPVSSFILMRYFVFIRAR